jgi:hypothetical protein
MGDRLTVKGSMRLRRERKPIPHDAPRIGMLRLCGADIRGNLDMHGCLLRIEQHNSEIGARVAVGADAGDENAERKNTGPSLFADGLTVPW